MYAPNRQTILDNSKAYVVRTVCHIVTCITGESVTFQQADTHVIMRANHGWRNAEPALQFKCWCARPAPLAGIEVGFSRGSACPAPVSTSNWATKCASHTSHVQTPLCGDIPVLPHPKPGSPAREWHPSSPDPGTSPLHPAVPSTGFGGSPLSPPAGTCSLLPARPFTRCCQAPAHPTLSHSNSLNYSASAARSGWASHSFQFSASRHCISPLTLSSLGVETSLICPQIDPQM